MTLRLSFLQYREKDGLLKDKQMIGNMIGQLLGKLGYEIDFSSFQRDTAEHETYKFTYSE